MLKNLKPHAKGDWIYRTAETGHLHEVTVKYIKSSSLTRRGVYVDIWPKEIEPPRADGGFTSEIYLPFGPHVNAFVVRLARVNAREIYKVAESIDEHVPVLAAIFAAEGQDRCKEALYALLKDGTVPVPIDAIPAEKIVQQWLVRDQDGRYLRKNGWSSNIDHAYHFDTLEGAKEFSSQYPTSHVVLVQSSTEAAG